MSKNRALYFNFVGSILETLKSVHVFVKTKSRLVRLKLQILSHRQDSRSDFILVLGASAVPCSESEGTWAEWSHRVWGSPLRSSTSRAAALLQLCSLVLLAGKTMGFLSEFLLPLLGHAFTFPSDQVIKMGIYLPIHPLFQVWNLPASVHSPEPLGFLYFIQNLWSPPEEGYL